jgi:hypothetical protein
MEAGDHVEPEVALHGNEEAEFHRGKPGDQNSFLTKISYFLLEGQENYGIQQFVIDPGWVFEFASGTKQ